MNLMKPRCNRLAVLGAFFLLVVDLAAGAEKPGPTGPVEVLEASVLPVANPEVLDFLEGPAPGAGETLYFTNRSRQEGGASGISAIDLAAPEKEVRLAREGQYGGLWKRGGSLLATSTDQEGTGRVLLFPVIGKGIDPGEAQFLVEGEIDGRTLLDPNDLVADEHGGVYFTDKKGKAVFYIHADGKATMVASFDGDREEAEKNPAALNNPNGIILSPDGSRLYVTDDSNILWAPIKSPGVLAADLKHLLPEGGVAAEPYHGIAEIKEFEAGNRTRLEGRFGGNFRIDGMTVDAEGVIYGAGLSTGMAFGWDGKTGELVRVIRCPGGVTNLVFAGEDRKTLCLVGSFGVATVQMPVAGAF